jgi:hypothetical protein
LKKTTRRIETTRLESWATPGVPDVMLCAENGLFAFLELKVVHYRKIDLSPHQCAWLSRHSHSNCWIITRNSDLDISCYHGASVVDLRMGGIAAVPAVATFAEPYAWEEFFGLICPLD